ncbi:60S ribosomal protein L13 [Chondrus crispus]|uniref:60S ribosomal protein L13 n=1 Tax=Chondrus crispus TaxID=2769 RepID=R7Q712_CHOCR|nr:60S ribosomal protein L13 [Chondrus crispus]CDF34322.1 60S ribosomal protein L13 [Chondrus crispus]|eukprot:XP_005714141.1 60S ribosomal protein L13 [Chondrus crispus]
MKHNNVIPNNHFRKEWQLRVRTWFEQPMRKRRRRSARVLKYAKSAPRPIDGLLRPIVRCPTNKYNMHVRLGRGFSLEELKEAGIAVRYAPTIGIAVDPRRKNRSLDAMQDNVQRLKEFKTKLIVFPKNPAKPKEGEAKKEELAMAAQLEGKLMPIQKTTAEIEVRPITNDDRAKTAYRSLRIEKSNKKLEGIRKKRAAEKAAEKADKSAAKK